MGCKITIFALPVLSVQIGTLCLCFEPRGTPAIQLQTNDLLSGSLQRY